MWEYFWPDIAFDLVKGLVAGGASLALQAIAPGAFRALKRLRVRWRVRKAVQQAARRQCIERKLWRRRWLRR